MQVIIRMIHKNPAASKRKLCSFIGQPDLYFKDKRYQPST